MEKLYFVVKILLLIFQLINSSISFNNNNQINCKYYIIEHTSFYKLYSNSNYNYIIYQFESRHIKINDAFFRVVLNDFCQNKSLLNSLKMHLQETNSFIYGIDISDNYLNQTSFDLLVELHEYEFKWLRYMNLNNNNISTLKNYIFPYLETLILDRNPNFNDFNFDNKLKILSLNKCNLNDKNNLKIRLVKNQTVVYLGLAENKFTDMTSANELRTLGLIDCLASLDIDLLDLSYNRFHKLTTIKYLQTRINSIKKINLERNLFNLFDVNELASNSHQKTTEINLKYNFIRNTSLIYFKSTKLNPKITVKLYGNPLVCDCYSTWLLDELNLLVNKTHVITSREIEEISSHHSLDDLNFGFYRQKRIKFNRKQNRSIVQIVDINLLRCNFIDLKNYVSESYYNNEDLNFDLELKKQNILVKSIKFSEKNISSISHEDFVCYYEDYCRASECDCCVFKHCHCRSICPRQCRCYYDSTLMHNIIDCSSLSLIDVPSTSIETATDMRLNSNTLKILKSHSFFGFGQLKYLYLQNNQISFIAPDSFEDLKYSLKVLNLAENKLTYLNGDEFYGLNELAILILNGNPLKDIDNINLIDSTHLPSLRIFYLAETELPFKKLNELIQYSKNFPNISIKHHILPLTTDIIHLNTNYSEHEMDEYTSNNSTPKRLLNKYIFFQFKLLNWFYFPIFIFIVCLVLSLVIVFTVVIVARKYENDLTSKSSNTSSTSTASSTAQLKCKSNRLNRKYKNSCCCYVRNNNIKEYSFSSQSYENDKILKLGIMNNDYENIKNRSFLFDSCFGTLVCRPSNRSKTSSSFDSKIDNDLVSVPVSRIIDNLNFNVNIYFNVMDNDYIANYLLPCLKKCSTLVPDTKFILKSQTTNYVQLNHDTVFESSSCEKKLNSILVANILVISDNFYGFKPQTDSLISLKCNKKKQFFNYGNNHSSSGISSCRSSIYQEVNCYLINTITFDSYLNNTFKIYLSLDEKSPNNKTLIQKDNLNLYNSSKTYSLNQRLMKRLYETSTTSDKRASMYIQNDLSSSYAFSNQLQYKLEKHFQNVCLKSSKFSDSNFSYVDYTKR